MVPEVVEATGEVVGSSQKWEYQEFLYKVKSNSEGPLRQDLIRDIFISKSRSETYVHYIKDWYI